MDNSIWEGNVVKVRDDREPICFHLSESNEIIKYQVGLPRAALLKVICEAVWSRGSLRYSNQNIFLCLQAAV